jgi:colicin import membrane protein
MIKKILMMTIALTPLTLWAQDNTWEQPEFEQEQQVVKVKKVNPDQKYLRGAVPEVDGKVVFSTTIEAPGKSASEIYDIVHKYMTRMVSESNQINSRIAINDTEKHELGAAMEEWLVFKSAALALDRTRFLYTFQAFCQDGKVELKMSHLRYLYDENRKPQRLKAEEWITDKNAVNKKNTRLYPVSAKFRRKTIDRKDFLFNKIESLLK